MKKVIFLAAAVFCLAACSTEDDMTTQYNDNIVRIGSATVAGTVQSRVSSIDNGDSFEDGDEILLVNESRDDLNEDVYAYNQLAWTAKGDGVYWKIGGENIFKAQYPANRNFWDIMDQSTIEKLSLADWMEASVSAKKGNDISLSFSHQRAKVIINCDFSGYEGKTVTMTEPKIWNNFSITPYCSNNQLIAILNPKPECVYSDDDKFIELKVNGITYTVYANDFLKNTGLEEGKVYTFNLTITNKEMTISTVDVKDWTGNTLEEVQAIAAIVDASNHSISTYEQNQLNADFVKKAFGEETELSIVGPMGDTDFSVLKKYLQSLDESSRISLDLSDASVTEIPQEAFKNVNTIKTIKLPKTVRIIKRAAFYSCTNLNVLNLSERNSLVEIGESVFSNIALTGEVILPRL